MFSAEKLRTDLPGSVSLTREALLLVAILTGADYDEVSNVNSLFS